MAQGFHKPGDGPQKEPNRDREEDSQAPRREQDRGSFPENPRDGKAYGDDNDAPPPPERRIRPTTDRIGSGYGNRHSARQDDRPPARDYDRRPPRENFRREEPRRNNFRDDRRRDDYRQDDRREQGDFRRDEPRRDNYRDDRQRDDYRQDDRRRDDIRQNDRREQGDFRQNEPRRDDYRRDDRPRDNYRRNDNNDRGFDRRDDRRDNYRRDDRNERQDDRRDNRRFEPREQTFRQTRGGRERYEFTRDSGPSRSQEWRRGSSQDQRSDNPPPEKDKRRFKPPAPPNLDASSLNEPIRLNKYLARSTAYSRRESDELIKRGRVTVNDEVVSPGHMVQPGDVVLFDEKPVSRRDHLAYILINKPKDIATTTTPSQHEAGGAPQNVADILKFEGVEQLESIAPIESDMLGLQLVSNDPQITKHFEAHPPKETYTILLSEPGAADLILRLMPEGKSDNNGILLAEFADEEHLRMSIVVRGGFPAEALKAAGITCERVDRLHFAGLTKKDLPRGHWRFLSDREITWVTKFQQ